MWIFLPQRMQPLWQRVLLYRYFLICGILKAGEIIFALKRQVHYFNRRNQFHSESQILNLIMGQRPNHSVVGPLFRKRNFTTQAHRYLFSGTIIYPLPRIKCFSQSNLRIQRKFSTESIRLLQHLQYPSRHYLLNGHPILNFLPGILGACAKHQIAVTYAAL